jgi:hypothetical protein
MALVYDVHVNGISVWSHSEAHYNGLEVFPSEYLVRPTTGVVTLFLGNQCIANMIPLEEEENMMAALNAIAIQEGN